MGQAPPPAPPWLSAGPGSGTAYLRCRWHSQACAQRAEGRAAGRCPPAEAAPFWKDMSAMRHRREATRGCLRGRHTGQTPDRPSGGWDFTPESA